MEVAPLTEVESSSNQLFAELVLVHCELFELENRCSLSLPATETSSQNELCLPVEEISDLRCTFSKICIFLSKELDFSEVQKLNSSCRLCQSFFKMLCCKQFCMHHVHTEALPFHAFCLSKNSIEPVLQIMMSMQSDISFMLKLVHLLNLVFNHK